MTDLLADRPGVMAADTVKPGYTMNKAYFQYDPQDGLYHRYQYGGVHQGNEGPITVKNVIFQCCQMGHYATTEYLNINVHAAECGYFHHRRTGHPYQLGEGRGVRRHPLL